MEPGHRALPHEAGDIMPVPAPARVGRPPTVRLGRSLLRAVLFLSPLPFTTIRDTDDIYGH